MSLTQKIKNRSLITPEAKDLSNSLPPIKYSIIEIPNYPCPDIIIKKRLWSSWGVFWDYLLRRDICILTKSKIYDDRAAELGKPKDYKEYKDSSKKSLDTINAIWRISHSHTLWWMMKKGEVDLVSYWLEIEELDSMLDMSDMVEITDISFTISDILIRRYGPIIETNPDFKRVIGFNADADIMMGSTMIDFKTSKYEASYNLDYHIQLSSYSALGRITGKTITKMAFVNPLLGIISECNISLWDKENSLISAIKKI